MLNIQGYVIKWEDEKIYKLKKKKTSYGLHQTPKAWYTHIDNYFVKNGFQRYPYKHTLYIKSNS